MTFRLTISTPDKTCFEGLAKGVVCPGSGGYFGVLAGHAPMVSVIGTGIVKVEPEEGATLLFVVDGGLADVGPQAVSILADWAVKADTLAQAEEKLEEARARAVPDAIR
jgi:F-type H+-transporting ATPase subunit epsilon